MKIYSRLTGIVCLLAGSALAQTTSTPQTTRRPSTAASTTEPVPRRASTANVALPAGTAIEVRVNESLSSETSQQGERFTGTVTSDVTDEQGRVMIPRGAEINGRVLSATPSGRLSDAGELQLSINTIRTATSVVNVTVEPFAVKGQSHTKSNTTKIGGGAALGAIIGAIAGGGKGAAIGAGVGGAAGAGAAAATGKQPAEVKPEALLKFVTATTTTLSASGMGAPRTKTAQADSAAVPQADQQPAQSPSTKAGSAGTDAGTTTSSPSAGTPTSTYPSASSEDDREPVMQRRPSTTATTPGGGGTASTAASPQTNTSAGTGSQTTMRGGTSEPTVQPSTSTSGSVLTTGTSDPRLFSARDRRVVSNCVRDNAASLPQSALGQSATSRRFQRGETIPADVQRYLRSLPLACDRELPQLTNDLERVIYAGQVMLIDSSNRVIDVFAVLQ